MQTSISSGAPVPRALRCLTRHRRLTASRTHNKRPFSSSNRPPKKVLAPPKATSSPAQPAPEQPEEGTRAPNGSDLQSVSHSSPSTAESGSFGKRIKRFFGGDRLDRKRLQALGLGAVASYGFVSNATYGTGLAISWVTFVRQTGKSPLMAQQWKPFLALYGGFWAAQHFIRPLRFSLALAMAPVFDKFINFVQHKTHFRRQNAFAIYLCLLGSVTSICVFGSIRVFAGSLAFAMC